MYLFTFLLWSQQFAFVGRSNVGKSSLLNALLSKPLARTSNTPVRLFSFAARTLSCG